MNKQQRADAKRFRRLTQIPREPWQLPIVPACAYCGAMRFPKESKGFCCASGKIKLHLPKMPTRLWDLYVNDTTALGKEFRRMCRSYNNSLAFTSIRMTYDKMLARGNQGVYTFKVCGAIKHYIRELTPRDDVARHLQLYFYGGERDMQNQIVQNNNLDASIVELLVGLLRVNPYHNFFTNAREITNLDSYAIRLRANPNLDPNVYNLPVVEHVAALWNEGTGPALNEPRDIRVNLSTGGTSCVHYYYGCYDPLQYCLLFPYGEPGWHAGMPKLTDSIDLGADSDEGSEEDPTLMSVDPVIHVEAQTLLRAEHHNLCRNAKKPASITVREFYAYLFQTRDTDITNILRAGRLVQQYQIDMYVKLETQRLDFLRHNQSLFEVRAENYRGLVESMTIDGMTSTGDVGQRMLLPPSFTGGPRDLRRRYMNALALVTEFGRPDFFITMTCNPKWVEIQQELLPNEKAQDRGDLLARVFRAKNEELKREIVTKGLFGEVAAYFYVIEFQKRGLPHVHWLIILKPRYKLTSSDAYDRFVSAEIPNPTVNPHLHACVVNHMMHGPCGELNKENSCMTPGYCRNFYPKEFVEVTEHREDSYPNYRRRKDDAKVLVRRHWLDNRWVVPYNAYLLAKFDCHINVQICTDLKSVKYLYKYICKGHARIAYDVVGSSTAEPVDEISDYQTSRWLCAPEAMWRIYNFDLFEMHPPVLQQHVHLPDYQRVCFQANQDLATVVDTEKLKRTQLTEFFRLNRDDTEIAAMNLLYRHFPKYFVWLTSSNTWKRRDKSVSIGRLVAVSIMDVERFYLRLLLNHVRAPPSYEFLRTVDSTLLPTFREAALHRGLLDSDNDVRSALDEASGYKMPYVMRHFFATILAFNSPSDPKALWEEFKDDLSAELLRQHPGNLSLGFTLSLQSIDTFLQAMGHSVDEYSLVGHKVGLSRDELYTREFEIEMNTIVDAADLASVDRLNELQRFAFDAIMASLDNSTGSAYFIDGPGGTGKTFLYKALMATVRSRREIVLPVASSGVAASLLPNGRTAHSRFKIPLKLDESMSCSISKNTAHARLIKSASLILWDEASMANRKAVEALNLLLQDLMGNNLLFGGKTVVLGGDFRQTIPIIRRGTREDTVDACLVHSALWPRIRKIHLTDNMRALEDPVFTEFLLNVGDGTEPCVEGDFIKLPAEMCLPYQCSETSLPLDKLIQEVFPSLEDYHNDPMSHVNTAILTPKNDCMEEINKTLIEKFPGDMVEYISNDLANDPNQQAYYQDFMNGVSVGGLPPHVLQLRVNCPVMLLRNINPIEGLCNGTRLIVRDLGRRAIGATIAVGSNKGKYVLIPRIPLELEDNFKCPVPFKRFQFPIRLCFAMSINKAQGQTLDRVGVYLPRHVFSHGQLYVALSRVRTANSIKFLIKPPVADMESSCKAKNVVYKEILQAAT